MRSHRVELGLMTMAMTLGTQENKVDRQPRRGGERKRPRDHGIGRRTVVGVERPLCDCRSVPSMRNKKVKEKTKKSDPLWWKEKTEVGQEKKSVLQCIASP